MLNIFEDVIVKKGNYQCIKVECSICCHVWYVRRYRLKDIKKCPACYNKG